MACNGTCCVVLPLVTFSVAVETPSCDVLVTFGATKVMVTVQDFPAARELRQLVVKENLFALAPVPGVREMLSGAVVFPVFLMVTVDVTVCCESTSPKLMLLGDTVTPLTARVAEAVLPVPPLVDVTLPVVLVKLPG